MCVLFYIVNQKQKAISMYTILFYKFPIKYRRQSLFIGKSSANILIKIFKMFCFLLPKSSTNYYSFQISEISFLFRTNTLVEDLKNKKCTKTTHIV